MPEFARNMAFIVGISNYSNGISPLQNAVNDAKKLVKILREKYEYEVWVCLDEMATLTSLEQLICEILPQDVNSDDRLLFYFAGHGIALSGDDSPQGYLIPQDAVVGDTNTYLPMSRVHEYLSQLPCRHFLGILDCYFTEVFGSSSTPDILPAPEVIYPERYEQFLSDVWMRTPTASETKALDANNFNSNGGEITEHLPLAAALFEMLQDGANLDSPQTHGQQDGDGAVMATELYMYLYDKHSPTLKQATQSVSLQERLRQEKRSLKSVFLSETLCDGGAYPQDLQDATQTAYRPKLSIATSHGTKRRTLWGDWEPSADNGDGAKVMATKYCSGKILGQLTLKKYGKGEYIFFAPNHQMNFPLTPPLDESHNNSPPDLQSFEEEHQQTPVSFEQHSVQQKRRNTGFGLRWIITILAMWGVSILAIYALLNPREAQVAQTLTPASTDLIKQKGKQSRPNGSYSPSPAQIIAEDFYTRVSYEAEASHQWEIIKSFNQIVNKDPNNADAYVNIGVAYYRQGQYKQAIPNFNQALRIDPKNVHAYINRGIAYHRLGQYNQTVADCTQAIKINPKNADAYISRGIAHRWLGNYEQAIADFNQAISNNPENADAYYAWALTNAQRKDIQAAIENYQKAANLYQKQGKTDFYQSALNRIQELKQ
ncbi:hypothetical protein BZZ01_11045 [Nostocales cyanobacterium HT-58-2]|nr:hypothetical protein BZZ01_11045 [Nostocales cyanobacterium HT-58-2]